MKPAEPRILAEMMRGDAPLLETVRSAFTAETLANGVDLLRTSPNECSLLQGRTAGHQIWQRVRFTSDPPTIERVIMHVDHVTLIVRPGTHRFDHMRLVKSGSVVRAIVREHDARHLSLATLEIFGWEVTDSSLPSVEEALRLLETPGSRPS
jgi:hypothetical protein